MSIQECQGQTAASLDEIEQCLMVQQLSPAAKVAGSSADAQGRTRHLLTMLGNPQEHRRVVHVAGTAGKGSVSAFLTSILCAHGFRVGTYASPHVYSLLERFQLDGQPADPTAFAPVARAVRDAVFSSEQGISEASMFELATAAAYLFFDRENVDYAVVETGIGGLRDATNTVRRSDKLAVITVIGIDHTEVLGDTLAAIAIQKAGIFPFGGEAVALSGQAVVDDAIKAVAAQRHCDVRMISPRECADVVSELQNSEALEQPHNQINAGLALNVAGHLANRDGWTIDWARAAVALLTVNLPGRFEHRVWNGTQILLDGAHNPLKFAALVDATRRRWPGRKLVWVVAIKAGKDAWEGLKVLSPHAHTVIATEFDTRGRRTGRGRAVPAGDLGIAASDAGIISVYVEPSLAHALRRGVAMTSPGSPLVVTGSFHTVADAAEVMDR